MHVGVMRDSDSFGRPCLCLDLPLALASYNLMKALTDRKSGAISWRASFEGHPPVYFAFEQGHATVADVLLQREKAEKGSLEKWVMTDCLNVAVKNLDLRAEDISFLVSSA